MKVLLITALYHIEGRQNLARNTSAIHYLLKHWPKDTEILVVNEYHVYAKNALRYLAKNERNYLKNGYAFADENIDVNMIELPLLPKQKKLLVWQKAYMVRRIRALLQKKAFVPDIVVVHQPCCYVGQYIGTLQLEVRKVAILHITDQQYCQRDAANLRMLQNEFDAFYCRSLMIYDYFKEKKLPNLHEEIVSSGVPEKKLTIHKHFNEDCLELLYAGKLTKRKHVDLLLEALKDLRAKRDFHLTIAGGGPEEKKLKKLCHKYHLQDKVFFAGLLAREEVYKLYGNSDIFIMPSTGETLGLVYLEAMRQGCIPIGTAKEGIDGIIEDGVNGFLTLRNDVACLSAILKKLLNADAEYLFNLSGVSKCCGDKYNEKDMGRAYYNLILRERGFSNAD